MTFRVCVKVAHLNLIEGDDPDPNQVVMLPQKHEYTRRLPDLTSYQHPGITRQIRSLPTEPMVPKTLKESVGQEINGQPNCTRPVRFERDQDYNELYLSQVSSLKMWGHL